MGQNFLKIKIILGCLFLFYTAQAIGGENKFPFTIAFFNNDTFLEIEKEPHFLKTHEFHLLEFLRKSELNYKFKKFSWLRAMRDIQRDPELLMYGVSRTDEREDKLTWILPLYKLNFSLYGLNSPNKSKWTKENLYNGNLKIGCHSQSNACEYLRQKNIPETVIFEFVSSSPAQQLHLLDGGRVDFIFLSHYEMQRITEKANLNFANYSKSDLVQTTFIEYLVGNKNIDPNLVSQIRDEALRLGYGLNNK